MGTPASTWPGSRRLLSTAHSSYLVHRNPTIWLGALPCNGSSLCIWHLPFCTHCCLFCHWLVGKFLRRIQRSLTCLCISLELIETKPFHVHRITLFTPNSQPSIESYWMSLTAPWLLFGKQHQMLEPMSGKRLLHVSV